MQLSLEIPSVFSMPSAGIRANHRAGASSSLRENYVNTVVVKLQILLNEQSRSIFFFLHISFNKRSFRCTRENEITSKCQIKDLSLITDLFLNSIIIIYFTDKFIENLVRDKTERETYDSLLE